MSLLAIKGEVQFELDWLESSTIEAQADSIATELIGVPSCRLSVLSGELGGLSVLSLVVLPSTLKFRSREMQIGQMLESLMCSVGAVGVNKDCLANESNWSVFLNPVHLHGLFRCVNDMALTSCCRSTV